MRFSNLLSHKDPRFGLKSYGVVWNTNFAFDICYFRKKEKHENNECRMTFEMKRKNMHKIMIIIM